MSRGKAWTPEEDAFLRENREHGPSWEGYRRAMPGRTEIAIASRRKKLGITFKHGERRAYNQYWKRLRFGRKGEAATPPPRRASAPWTDEQRVALVRLATEMVDACDHELPECLEELGRIIAEWRRERSA